MSISDSRVTGARCRRERSPDDETTGRRGSGRVDRARRKEGSRRGLRAVRCGDGDGASPRTARIR